MANKIRSISEVGTTEPFFLQLGRGDIPGHSLQHKFGAVPAMSQNQTGSVWDVNDTFNARLTAAWDMILIKNDGASS